MTKILKKQIETTIILLYPSISLNSNQVTNCIRFFFKEITTKWNEVQALVPQRDQDLHSEYQKQQQNERLRLQFAQKQMLLDLGLNVNVNNFNN